MLPTITLKNFAAYQSTNWNWSGIPIEFLDVFRKLVPPSQYKYAFKGFDPKGRSSYLKLYAKTFSVCFRESEVQRFQAKRQNKAARKQVLALLAKYNISIDEVI